MPEAPRNAGSGRVPAIAVAGSSHRQRSDPETQRGYSGEIKGVLTSRAPTLPNQTGLLSFVSTPSPQPTPSPQRRLGPTNIAAALRQSIEQIAPCWIFLGDQPQLPRAFPSLDALFSDDCGFHVFVHFVPNQTMHCIFFVKPSARPFLCCHTRCIRLDVTPVYNVPWR